MARRARLAIVVLALAAAAAGGVVLVGRGAASFASTALPGTAQPSDAATAPPSGSAGVPAPLPSAPTAPTTTATTPTPALATSRATPASGASDPPADATVHVAISYVDYDAAGAQIEAAGLVAGLVESGGTCTLTLTQGPATVRTTGSAQPDATSTDCGHLTVPRSQVSPGPWLVVLSYRSATSSGTSQPMTVGVPA